MAAKGVTRIISADDYQAEVNSLTEEDDVDVERKASAAHTALGGGSQLNRLHARHVAGHLERHETRKTYRL